MEREGERERRHGERERLSLGLRDLQRGGQMNLYLGMNDELESRIVCVKMLKIINFYLFINYIKNNLLLNY